ncbi:MaoC family dehydratase [Patulibacter brassicae]|uniref:MaoC family dehydratase n=1 Tax=Patulibacter brassicae TaxID=1705717 RepID=A0ABU4VLC8_9ACTN|nr:MaoC family dehydratase [Patulibacter brassicae]MDX8152588.1 MaoC family dehydratase [Patulibacter brassicae]
MPGRETGPTILDGRAAVLAAVGGDLGISGWRVVGQAEIDAFAAVTGDDYWVHVDPARAGASRHRGTIAHGLLTLSLGPVLTYELVTFRGFSSMLNYGFDRVRFIRPVPSGSRVRMRLRVVDAEIVTGGIRARMEQAFERDGEAGPACVARSVVQLLD